MLGSQTFPPLFSASRFGDNAGDFVNRGPGKYTVNEMPGDKGPKNVYEHCEVFAR